MEKIRSFIVQVLTLLFVLLIGAFSDYNLFAMGMGGFTLSSAAGLLAKVANNPQAWQKWEKLAFKQGEYKTEFNESELGTTFADDGPKPSQRVAAAPILYYQELKSGGHKVSIRYKQPVFTETGAILNKGRYHNQTRMGAEHKLEDQHFQAIVDKWHFGLRETDLEGGEQITANMTAGQVMKRFVDEITDQEQRKKDTGMFFAMFAGYDIHHFINAGLRAGLSNAAVPVKDGKYGLNSTMTEHPNSFVYVITGGAGVIEKVTYSATQATWSNNLTTALSKITDAAKPSLTLIKKINRWAVGSNMIPCRIRLADGKMHSYYLLLIPGKIKDLLEEDTNYFKLMTESHQGIIDKNPLLRAGDVMYKNLIIRESNKLDDPYFSARNSFNATGGTATTNSAFNISGSGAEQEVSITPGVREFAAGSAALSALGAANTHLVGRMLLLGANAGTRTIGKEFGLQHMEITDYGLNDGVGLTKMYGQQRVSSHKVGADGLEWEKTPQSAQFFAFQGDL